MKVSYRRIAKAKKKLAQGRPLLPTERTIMATGLARIIRRRIAATRITLAAMSAYMGAHQALMIQSKPRHRDTDPVQFRKEKALALMEVAITTAASFNKAFLWPG